MKTRRSLCFFLLVIVPLASANVDFATRSILGGASNFAKSAVTYGANFAQSAASTGTNLAQGVAREVAGATANIAKNAAISAKNVSETVVDKAKEGAEVVVEKAKEGAKDAAHAAQVGAKEVLVVASDPTQPIFPGTRWCGAGNKAENASDVGLFDSVDVCCRSHDKCFDNIPAGGSKHGLENNGTFTRSHCDCDEEFYKCLKKADNLVAKKVGFTYFNVLRPQCFREERPVVRCAKSSGVAVTKRCSEYEFARSNKRNWQWFDAKEF